MVPALMANCLDKIANQLAEIRLCVQSVNDAQAREYADSMEDAFAAHEQQVRLYLNISKPRTACHTTWQGTEDPQRFLSDAFDKIHDHLRSLRFHATQLADANSLDALQALELALLKPLRRLRLHLDIPYDWHAKVSPRQ